MACPELWWAQFGLMQWCMANDTGRTAFQTSEAADFVQFNDPSVKLDPKSAEQIGCASRSDNKK